MIVAAIFLTLAASIAAASLGWIWGAQLGDDRGVLGWALGVLVMGAGVSAVIDWFVP